MINDENNKKLKGTKHYHRASRVVEWLRVHLPMQGTRVRAPVREDPTCHGAARPVRHGHWACTSGACAPQRERPMYQKKNNNNKIWRLQYSSLSNR